MRLFQRAAEFIDSRARLIERRLFDRLFRAGTAESVSAAVRAYQNADGGLGFALEPDLRTPRSQPLFAEIGLNTLSAAGARDRGLAEQLCEFLDRVAAPDGLVPPALPDCYEHARAGHWDPRDFALSPSLNVTLGVCGLLHEQGAQHPWLERATATGLERLAQAPPTDAHSLLGATRFVELAPGGAACFDAVAAQIPGASFFLPDAPVTGYGVTPLQFAPRPDSPWAALFRREQLDAHLDDLASRQQEDGGWPIAWQAPGPTAELEWRGRLTLEALTTLCAYGRAKSSVS